MNFLIKRKLKNSLKKYLGSVNSSNDAVDGFINFLTQDKTIKNLAGHEDSDMALFQYGKYDWTGDGENFEFNLTRQYDLGVKDDDEFYHLSLTLYFDPEDIDIESYDSWNSDFDSIDEWKKNIYESPGYIATQELKPLKVEIDLNQT